VNGTRNQAPHHRVTRGKRRSLSHVGGAVEVQARDARDGEALHSALEVDRRTSPRESISTDFTATRPACTRSPRAVWWSDCRPVPPWSSIPLRQRHRAGGSAVARPHRLGHRRQSPRGGARLLQSPRHDQGRARRVFAFRAQRPRRRRIASSSQGRSDPPLWSGGRRPLRSARAARARRIARSHHEEPRDLSRRMLLLVLSAILTKVSRKPGDTARDLAPVASPLAS